MFSVIERLLRHFCVTIVDWPCSRLHNLNAIGVRVIDEWTTWTTFMSLWSFSDFQISCQGHFGHIWLSNVQMNWQVLNIEDIFCDSRSNMLTDSSCCRNRDRLSVCSIVFLFVVLGCFQCCSCQSPFLLQVVLPICISSRCSLCFSSFLLTFLNVTILCMASL